MKSLDFKYTPEIAETLKTRMHAALETSGFTEELQTLTYADIVAGADEKARKVQQDNGTFDVIISTEVKDRAGEVVMQNGWDLVNYKNNPIVLWGHDYYSLPIGACLETYMTTFRGVPALGARGVFLSADVNPLAQQVRKLYEFGMKVGQGVGCTTSVGFIPKEFDPNDQSIITRSELLEFSFVPVPANQGVGAPSQGRALTFAEAESIGLDVVGLSVKGLSFMTNTKTPIAGDECTMDDGTPGKLSNDPNDPGGPLVCLPDDQNKPDKKDDDAGGDDTPALDVEAFNGAVAAEHGRHTAAVTKAIDDFRAKAATVIEDQPDMNDEKAVEKKADAMTACLKALGTALDEEHDMHRSTNVACFRSFASATQKATKQDSIKDLKAEHKTYDTNSSESFKEFADKMKSVEMQGDDHIDWITGKMMDHAGVHEKAVQGIAKAYCASFDDEGDTEVKEMAIVIVKMTAELETPIAEDVALKIGAALSAASKAKIKDAHDAVMTGVAMLRAIHGDLGGAEPAASGEEDDTGDEGESKAHDATADEDFSKFLEVRDLGRSLAGTLNAFLSESRGVVRHYHRKGK